MYDVHSTRHWGEYAVHTWRLMIIPMRIYACRQSIDDDNKKEDGKR